MDNRKNNGGAREGAGRKPKAQKETKEGDHQRQMR